MSIRSVPPGAAFAFEMGIRTLDQQLRRIEALDTKAGILMAANGVLSGLLFGGPLALHGPRSVAVPAAVALMVSLVTALVSFANRRYDSAPNPQDLVDLVASGEDVLNWRLVGSVLEILEVNGQKLDTKTRFLTVSLLSLIATVVLAGGYSLSRLLIGA
jgi:hypothetical protein